MNKHELMALRPYWSGWRLRSPSEKDDIFDTWSFYDLTSKMRAKARYRFAKELYEGRNIDCDWHGSNIASTLASTAAPFWSDFDDLFPHHFMKYHYQKLPDEHHATAKHIVEGLNKMKGGAWAYALCLVGFPDYEKHHMREKILKELDMKAEVYDATTDLMRKILQEDKYR